MTAEVDAKPGQQDPAPGSEQVVYMIPAVRQGQAAESEIRLDELAGLLWRRRWLIMLITAVAAVVALTYVLSATSWYRAEIVLAPAEDRASPLPGGQLGNLAALAGTGMGRQDVVQGVATLQSREFARAFISEQELLPVLLPERDSLMDRLWRPRREADGPDTRDAVRYFHRNVLRVREDRQTGLITVSVDWKDPDMAAQWAELIVGRLNEQLRAHALANAEANINYLQGELAQTSVLALQQSIGRLLEGELQKLMLARGNEEFVFRVLDPAEAPKYPVRPQRLLITLAAALGGLVAGVFIALLVGARGHRS